MVLLIAAGTCVSAGEWTGKLDRKLSRAPDTDYLLWQSPPPPDLPPGYTLYEGFLKLRRFEGDGINVSAIESPTGSVELYVDLNGNCKFDRGESFRFHRLKHDPNYEQEAIVKIHLNKGPFQSYKIRFVIPKRGKEGACAHDQRVIFVQSEPLVTGHARLGRRKLRVAWYYSLKDAGVAWRQGMDANLDGHIDFGWTSPENDFYQAAAPPVFRVGQRYVQADRVDVVARKFRLIERPAGEYTRIELMEGNTFPVFAFQDFQGAQHNTREYRGHWLLIHYWEYPCTPCYAGFPYIRKAWEQMRARKLEVLGICPQPFGSAALQAASDHGAIWTQARGESFADITRRARISAMPTLILLDPEGRIAVVDRSPTNLLRGDQLLQTLDDLLPR